MFFVWVSVFNLFAVAVFWSFMADLFTSEQGKRLFGFIGAGGTAGALLGPIITIWLSVPLGPVNLMIAAAYYSSSWLYFACTASKRTVVVHCGVANAERKHRRQRIRGHTQSCVRSPYLLGHRRLGRAPVVCRDHHLFRAGAYRLGGGQECGPSDADFRQYRPRR